MQSDHQSSKQYQNFFKEPQISMSWVSLSRSFSTDEFNDKNIFNRNDDFLQSMIIMQNHQSSMISMMSNDQQNFSKQCQTSKDLRKRKKIAKKNGVQRCKCTKNQCNNNYCSCKRQNNKCSSECGCTGCLNNTFIRKISCKIEDFSFFSFDFNNKQSYHHNNL